MDAFRLLRKKFYGGEDISKSSKKSPSAASKTDNTTTPSTSNETDIDCVKDTKVKPAIAPKPKEKKRIHVTAEKAKEVETLGTGERKSSLSEEKLQELQEAFVLFDKNRDGMISKEELGAVLYALGQRPTVMEVQALIRSVDLDKSGTIDFDEFVKMFSAQLTIDPEQELHEVFCIFDENGDGFICADELYEMLRKLGEHITKSEAHKMIHEADINRDGKVDYKEFKAILNAR
ncbi:Calmodulin-3 [Mactra antiquata]